MWSFLFAVSSNLVFIQRPGYLSHKCKMFRSQQRRKQDTTSTSPGSSSEKSNQIICDMLPSSRSSCETLSAMVQSQTNRKNSRQEVQLRNYHLWVCTFSWRHRIVALVVALWIQIWHVHTLAHATLRRKLDPAYHAQVQCRVTLRKPRKLGTTERFSTQSTRCLTAKHPWGVARGRRKSQIGSRTWIGGSTRRDYHTAAAWGFLIPSQRPKGYGSYHSWTLDG